MQELLGRMPVPSQALVRMGKRLCNCSGTNNMPFKFVQSLSGPSPMGEARHGQVGLLDHMYNRPNVIPFRLPNIEERKRLIGTESTQIMRSFTA